MLDTNWDLVDTNVAHEIEVLNYANTVNVIEAVVRVIQYYSKEQGMPEAGYPAEPALKELHRTGTLFLLDRAGQYRDNEVSVYKNGVVVHTPPLSADVQNHMNRFFERLNDAWFDAPEGKEQPFKRAVEMGALSLWMLNWVHPFRNGNGRTARAFCYACMSLKLGVVPPGTPTVIDMIMNDRDRYDAALKAGDTSFEKDGEPDLALMREFLADLLLKQLDSVPSVTDDETQAGSTLT